MDALVPAENTADSVSPSLLIAGKDDALARLAATLRVKPAHCFQFEPACDFAALAKRCNTLFFGAVTGDFSWRLDVHLFVRSADSLDAALLALSAAGDQVALPDQGSMSPFRYVLYEQARRSIVDIVENDDSSVFWSHRNAAP